MKVFVLGHKGKIGSALVNSGAIAFPAMTTNYTQLERVWNEIAPPVDEDFTVINASGKTNVVYCENNREDCNTNNAISLINLLRVIITKDFKQYHKKFRFIQLSSSHVFSGDKFFPYSEYHKPDPVNAYGWSKLMGEGIVSSFDNKEKAVLRIGKAVTQETIDGWCGMSADEKAPTFIHRNYIKMSDLTEKIMKIATQVDLNDLPWNRKTFFWGRGDYRVLHVGDPLGNRSLHQMINLVRDENNLPLLEGRNWEHREYVPRPRRVSFSLKEQEKLV